LGSHTLDQELARMLYSELDLIWQNPDYSVNQYIVCDATHESQCLGINRVGRCEQNPGEGRRITIDWLPNVDSVACHEVWTDGGRNAPMENEVRRY
jgi:hypothetical protein